MEIKFLAPAEAELVDAISYYNMQGEGLGYEFAAEVKRTIERIIQYPEAWTKLSKRTRRCRTNRFPFRKRAILSSGDKPTAGTALGLCSWTPRRALSLLFSSRRRAHSSRAAFSCFDISSESITHALTKTR